MNSCRTFFQRWFGFTIAGVLAVTAFGQDPIEVSGTKEVLITSVRESERFNGTQKGDEALWIRDEKQVARLVSLFDGNIQHKVHACGYHWRLIFYRTDGQITEIFFNEDCEDFDRNTEEICAVVQTRFRETVEQPNAFLVNFDIDVNVDPETAKSDLRLKGDLRVLALLPIKRLPYVEIRASSTSTIPEDRSLWDSEKAKVIQVADGDLTADISRIREKYRVKEVGQFDLGMSMFGGGEITEQRKVKVYFDVGTNLSQIGKLLTQSKIRETVIPETYRLQVLNATRFANSDIKQMKRKFPFIRTIAQN